MKIDLLAACNQYGTTIHFIKGLATGLRHQGVHVRIHWVDDGQFYHALQDIRNDPPDVTCTFADISLNGQPLGDLLGIPHLSWLVDPPIYFLHQMRGINSIVACVDAEDTAFVKNLNFSKAFFLPHAGDVAHLTPVDSPRPYQTVFFGTCLDYEVIAAAWPKKEKELLLAASERVLSPDGITIAQALQELQVSPIDLPRFHSEVDRYTRGKDRVELIRSFQTPVHIWGDGPWKKYLPNHTIHPACTFDQTLTLMKQSQLVLNSTPRFKAGAHERLFYASLCGAAVYTGNNPYLSTHLPQALTYDFGLWQPPSFANWQTSAQACQQQTQAYHTWNARAETLLNSIKNL